MTVHPRRVMPVGIEQAEADLEEAAAGAWTGPVDGVWTDELTAALAAFQTELGVGPTGVVDAATLSAFQAALDEATTEPATTTSTTTTTTTASTSTNRCCLTDHASCPAREESPDEGHARCLAAAQDRTIAY